MVGQRLPGTDPLCPGLVGSAARRLKAEQRPSCRLARPKRFGGVEGVGGPSKRRHCLGRSDPRQHLHDRLPNAGQVLRPFGGLITFPDALFPIPADAIVQERVGAPARPLRYRVAGRAAQGCKPLQALVEAGADQVGHILRRVQQPGPCPFRRISKILCKLLWGGRKYGQSVQEAGLRLRRTGAAGPGPGGGAPASKSGRRGRNALLRRGVLPRRLFLRRRGRRICGLSLRRRPQRIDAG